MSMVFLGRAIPPNATPDEDDDVESSLSSGDFRGRKTMANPISCRRYLRFREIPGEDTHLLQLGLGAHRVFFLDWE